MGPVFLIKLFHIIPEFINKDCSLVICYADLYRGHKPLVAISIVYNSIKQYNVCFYCQVFVAHNQSPSAYAHWTTNWKACCIL